MPVYPGALRFAPEASVDVGTVEILSRLLADNLEIVIVSNSTHACSMDEKNMHRCDYIVKNSKRGSPLGRRALVLTEPTNSEMVGNAIGIVSLCRAEDIVVSLSVGTRQRTLVFAAANPVRKDRRSMCHSILSRSLHPCGCNHSLPFGDWE
jgi:hypothetical protein